MSARRSKRDEQTYNHHCPNSALGNLAPAGSGPHASTEYVDFPWLREIGVSIIPRSSELIT